MGRGQTPHKIMSEPKITKHCKQSKYPSDIWNNLTSMNVKVKMLTKSYSLSTWNIIVAYYLFFFFKLQFIHNDRSVAEAAPEQDWQNIEGQSQEPIFGGFFMQGSPVHQICSNVHCEPFCQWSHRRAHSGSNRDTHGYRICSTCRTSTAGKYSSLS